MPLYEYQCKQCGQDFEKMLRFDQSEEFQICPVCQSENTQKRISAFSSRGGNASLSASSTASGSCSSSRGGFT